MEAFIDPGRHCGEDAGLDSGLEVFRVEAVDADYYGWSRGELVGSSVEGDGFGLVDGAHFGIDDFE